MPTDAEIHHADATKERETKLTGKFQWHNWNKRGG